MNTKKLRTAAVRGIAALLWQHMKWCELADSTLSICGVDGHATATCSEFCAPAGRMLTKAMADLCGDACGAEIRETLVSLGLDNDVADRVFEKVCPHLRSELQQRWARRLDGVEIAAQDEVIS